MFLPSRNHSKPHVAIVYRMLQEGKICSIPQQVMHLQHAISVYPCSRRSRCFRRVSICFNFVFTVFRIDHRDLFVWTFDSQVCFWFSPVLDFAFRDEEIENSSTDDDGSANEENETPLSFSTLSRKK